MSSFPSLTIRADSLVPRGAFAEAQAAWLRPDPAAVDAVRTACEQGAVGIVAHFYMDAELQGVLVRVGPPHTFVADSLAMADVAVKMARDGKRTIVVLGVDFMTENVRAVLDAAGHADVEVVRVATRHIGCSLAASAEQEAYFDWLRSRPPHTLHVVYINTSLVTKARAHELVPTLTCTSSNVVRTLLQAHAQLPGAHLAYGPDTYMGGNLVALLTNLASLPADAVRAVHPDATPDSVRDLLSRLTYYEQGACVVHHLFGDDVVDRVTTEHSDALLAAHLEVPGRMFALAAAAQQQGRGVVGSTSNILDFVLGAVADAARRPGPQRISVVLGTESGMVTSIVARVQAALARTGRADVELEVVFPVASEAVTRVDDSPLRLVPGVAGGEGCSVEGGCATCPYMKMNSLDALERVLGHVVRGELAALVPYRPAPVTTTVGGRPAAQVGAEPILWMRHFQETGRLPDALVERVLRGGG
jgi:quinolinate synthase